MSKEEMIEKALNKDTELSAPKYAEKMRESDRATAAHGVEGEAPLNEEERERRMRMNFYGTMINIEMSILAALDELNNNVKVLNNNLVILSGGEASGNESNTDTGN